MNRWTWMVLRAYSPSFATLAFALTWVVSGWQPSFAVATYLLPDCGPSGIIGHRNRAQRIDQLSSVALGATRDSG